MRHLLTATATAALLVIMTAPSISAQDQTAPERIFDSENAILDTSVPFAIGAREAQQNLRGAFGWDTFQEGLVEGVYFRFDPDGYARFSSSPRLDTDVFEVICRPRTFNCLARKGSMEVILDARGRIQLKFDQISAGDTLVISEGVSELALPERILQPLDQRLEALLMAGGDLVHQRGDKEIAAISLQGFTAVVSYLRWVAARQDYTVLPRGWPVPNSNNSDGALTRADTWSSPMPQPQRAPTTGFMEVAEASNEVEDLADEVETLRDELRLRTGQVSPPVALTTPGEDVRTAERLAKLELTVEYILEDLRKLHAAGEYDESAMRNEQNPTASVPAAALVPVVSPTSVQVPPTPTNTDGSAGAVELLAQQLGMPEQTVAVLLAALQQGVGNSGEPNMQEKGEASAPFAIAPESGDLLKDRVVTQILSGVETTSPPSSSQLAQDDYQALAAYLGGIFNGQ